MSGGGYFAFSTAPGTHSGGTGVPSTIGHANMSDTGNLVSGHGGGDNLHAMLGVPSNMTVVPMSNGGGGGGHGSTHYRGSTQTSHHRSNSYQQRMPLKTVLNPHATAVQMGGSQGSMNGTGNGGSISVSGGGGLGGQGTGSGPAVPAPRSAATLLAEVTGAPPPPPAPSRNAMSGNNSLTAQHLNGGSGSGAAHPTNAVLATIPASANVPQMAMTTPPGGPISAGNTPMHGAGVPPRAPVSPVTTARVTPSFKAFTTSVAVMLSAQGGGIDLAESSTFAVESSTAVAPSKTAATGSFGHVEVQLTMGAPASGGEEEVTGSSGTGLDQLGCLLAALDGCSAESVMEEEKQSSYTADMLAGSDAYHYLLATHDCDRAAALIHTRLIGCQGDQVKLRTILRALTLSIVSEGAYKVLLLLPVGESRTLRHSVVHYLVSQLVAVSGSAAEIEALARGLATMMELNLVRPAGFAAVVDSLLQEELTSPVALRLLAHGLTCATYEDEIRAALRAVPRIAERLQHVYTAQPELEVDVALVTRHWQSVPPILYGSLPLEIRTTQEAPPVTCMSYFGVRDELVSGHMNGSVVLWGPPQMLREKSARNPMGFPHPVIRPRGVVPLPYDGVPVAMAGQRIDGQYLAIASMPYKGRRPYSRFCEAAETMPSVGQSAREAAKGAIGGAIVIINCNEHSTRWSKGEVMVRPAGVALTAITAFRSSIVVVGWSMTGGTFAAPHQLSFMDVSTGNAVRQIPQAHEDYITALSVLDEGSYVFLSGSRDASMKMWDPRLREDTPVVNTALCMAAAGRQGTITAMCSSSYNIISTSVDGSMLVWDLRAMEAPQLRHDFASPIVDLSMVHGRRAVAATARGLVTVSLETLEPLDMRYHPMGFSHVAANHSGELLFGASSSGALEVVAVGR